jgi:hypothetical protein
MLPSPVNKSQRYSSCHRAMAISAREFFPASLKFPENRDRWSFLIFFDFQIG